ncbi:protein GOS9-like isoform X2 [Chenopodium quinoa]|uniref:protein GOS9-like isoform X2 n=1 Tax=Chenopodium quinoa TaxID=63459 RepID=UPI000B786EF7|nr:protein GOS9-like isoform X2 [Chenopodium quinoa]
MVDAIGFTITGDDGDSRTNIYGGNGGNKNKINLQLGENILGISGRYKGSKISQLRIHTDLVPRGHGPYGDDELKDGSDFQSPMPLRDNQEVIGFFGSAQDSVASIGLYVQME